MSVCPGALSRAKGVGNSSGRFWSRDGQRARPVPQLPWPAARSRQLCPERHDLHPSQRVALAGCAREPWPAQATHNRRGPCRDTGLLVRRVAGLCAAQGEGQAVRIAHFSRPIAERPVRVSGPGARGRSAGSARGGGRRSATAEGRPLPLFVTAGQVRDHRGAWALGGRLPAVDRFRDALHDKGGRAGIPGRKLRRTSMGRDRRGDKRHSGIGIRCQAQGAARRGNRREEVRKALSLRHRARQPSSIGHEASARGSVLRPAIHAVAYELPFMGPRTTLIRLAVSWPVPVVVAGGAWAVF